MPGKPKMMSLRAAMQLLAVRSPTTMFGWAARGWITLRESRGRWGVETDGLRAAKVLTVGKVAKMARCSEKTVRRRIAAGLVSPQRAPRSVERAAGVPAARLSLVDVATIRGSLQRRVRRARSRTPGTRPAAPSSVAPPVASLDANGVAWLRWQGRWWRETPGAGPGGGRPSGAPR